MKKERSNRDFSQSNHSRFFAPNAYDADYLICSRLTRTTFTPSFTGISSTRSPFSSVRSMAIFVCSSIFTGPFILTVYQIVRNCQALAFFRHHSEPIKDRLNLLVLQHLVTLSFIGVIPNRLQSLAVFVLCRRERISQFALRHTLTPISVNAA